MIQFYDKTISNNQFKLSNLPESQLPNQDVLWSTSLKLHERKIESQKLGLLVVFVSLMCSKKEEFMTLFSRLPPESQYCLALELKPVSI